MPDQRGGKRRRPSASGARGGESHLLTSTSHQQGQGFLTLGWGWAGAREPGGRLSEVGAPCPCPALLYGDAEKPAESGGSQPPRTTSRKATCACNQKPCSCPKAEVNYAFLHATGRGASRGPGATPPTEAGSTGSQEPNPGHQDRGQKHILGNFQLPPRSDHDPDPDLCVALDARVRRGLWGPGAACTPNFTLGSADGQGGARGTRFPVQNC